MGHGSLGACGGSARSPLGWVEGGTFNGAPATLPVLPRPAPRTLLWLAGFLRLVCVGAVEGLRGSWRSVGTWRGGWQPTAPMAILPPPSCAAHSALACAVLASCLRGCCLLTFVVPQNGTCAPRPGRSCAPLLLFCCRPEWRGLDVCEPKRLRHSQFMRHRWIQCSL